MKISIVTTLYCSSENIENFYNRMLNAIKKITDNYEIIFVNDGSPDDSLDKVICLYRNDSNIKIIDLSRNFGHHRAALTGLTYATGDYVFLIDSDLEEPPETLTEFWGTMMNSNKYDVIYGVQEKRKGYFIENIGGIIFYKLFKLLSDISVEQNVLTVRLMTKKYVSALCEINEKELFMAGLFEYIGFEQKSLVIQKAHAKKTTYTLAKRLKLFVVGITSFSSFPLLISFYLGICISFLSFFYGSILVIRKVFFLEEIELGWTSLMVSIWFLGGMLLLSVGLIGIYLSKIYNEVKNRPPFVIKNIYEKSSHE